MSSLVSTGIGDDPWWVYHPGIYPGHSGPLSLAIPAWVGAMSTGDGFGHLLRRNDASEILTLWHFINQLINININNIEAHYYCKNIKTHK